MTTRIWKALGRYATFSKRDGSAQGAKARLGVIIEDAMVLNLDFKKQKSDYFFPQEPAQTGQFAPLAFDEDEMEALDSARKSSKVELVVAPALAKFKGYGDDVDVEGRMILMPAQVLCHVSSGPYKTQQPLIKRVLHRPRVRASS